MNIQEIFNEYIELMPYVTCNKEVFLNTTLYNSYIKPTFGSKEVSTLLLIDYQNFTNELLQKKSHDGHISRDRMEQIINVLISIYRFAIKSKYYQGENLPLNVVLDFNENNLSDKWIRESNEITQILELGELAYKAMKSFNKVAWLNGLRIPELDTRLSPTVSKIKKQQIRNYLWAKQPKKVSRWI